MPDEDDDFMDRDEDEWDEDSYEWEHDTTTIVIDESPLCDPEFTFRDGENDIVPF